MSQIVDAKSLYPRKCEIIVKILKGKYEVTNVYINSDGLTIVHYHMTNACHEITIPIACDLKDLMKRMDLLVTHDVGARVCRICCEEVKIQMACFKCSGLTCMQCYLEMFKQGHGEVKCPYCRQLLSREKPCTIFREKVDQMQETCDEVKDLPYDFSPQIHTIGNLIKN